MYFFTRFKLIKTFSLLLLFVIGPLILGSTMLATHVAGTTSTLPTKSSSASSASSSICGSWNFASGQNIGSGNNQLIAVAAISAKNAWVVGGYSDNSGAYTLIEHWNGTNWNVVPSPDPLGYFSYLQSIVTISAKNIWAVGGNYGSMALIEHWNGKSWKVDTTQPPIGTNALTSVARVPGTGQLWAVGYNSTGTEQTLIGSYC